MAEFERLTGQINRTETPLLVAMAMNEEEARTYTVRFEGLLAANTTTGIDSRVPKPNRINAARKAMGAIERQRSEGSQSLFKRADAFAKAKDISVDEATKLIEAADLIGEDLKVNGLTYRDDAFNFALATPYSMARSTANEIAAISTQALQATEKLAKENSSVNDLLNRGATGLERALWLKTKQGYASSAPLNRIDIINGKVIEFGPTYTDGFGTAQILADSFGSGSDAFQVLGMTFQELYSEFCQERGIRERKNPNLGMAYIPETYAMRAEMRALGNGLARSNRFGVVGMGRPADLTAMDPDLLYYYLKPSMIDNMNGGVLPEGQPLIQAYDSGICLVPPLKEQLGKKTVMALFRMYPEFYSQELGDSNYQTLVDFVTPTIIVTDETKRPDGDWVLKPAGEGSCNGVTSTPDCSFEEAFEQAKADYRSGTADVWVMQPKLKEQVEKIWVKSPRKELRLAKDLAVKQTLMVAGGKPAGGFATASEKWIIDDGGYGFPLRFTGQ